ncbi:MAG TPA: Wzz/FepE/Etk N-terminal domain-containing protein [Candidatus Dormibacteraeota bacterium]|jgi:capsular polysaccharide biosynthesis protein
MSGDLSVLNSIGRALRRRHRLVWLPPLLAIAGAGLLAAFLPPTYEATALLAIDEQQQAGLGFDLALQADQYLTQRYVAMATSRPVLGRACAQVGGGCDPAVLAGRVSAQPAKAAGVISVTVRDRDAGRAVRLANAVAGQVVAENRDQATASAAPSRNYLRGQLDQLQQQEDAIQARLAATPRGSGPDEALLAQLTQVQQQYSATYGRAQDLGVEQARLSAALLVRQGAERPSRPADPDLVRYVAVAGACGVTAGFLLALLVDRTDRRVRDAADLAVAAGAEVVLDAEPRVAAAECCALLIQGGSGAGWQEVLVVAASRTDAVDDVHHELARAATQLRQPMTVTAAPAPAVDPSTLVRARTASAAIVVATRGRTETADVHRTAHLLRRAGVRVGAAVLLPDRRVAALSWTGLRRRLSGPEPAASSR